MREFIKRVFDTPESLLFGNTLADWIAAAITFVAVWAFLWALRSLLARRYRLLQDADLPLPRKVVFELNARTTQLLFLGAALFLAKECLTLPPKLDHRIENFVLIMLLSQAGLWAGCTLRVYLLAKQRDDGGDRVLASSFEVINFLARVLIWSLLVLVALDNMGVNIRALLTGLGIGGVAVALALQNILGDLFASLSIALDKPFVVGDTLTIDTFTGDVEHVGLKTTRLRSEAGEEIIVANADILKSRMRNYGRATELRALATLRVAYGTPAARLREIPALLERIVGEQAGARFARCHLVSLGEWALQFELAYFRRKDATVSLLDLQHAVNCRIVEEFERAGIEFDRSTTRYTHAI